MNIHLQAKLKSQSNSRKTYLSPSLREQHPQNSSNNNNVQGKTGGGGGDHDDNDGVGAADGE